MPKLKPRIERRMLDLKESGKQITQTEIAQKMNVTKQQVNLWIQGRSYPRVPALFQLARILQCKTDDLYEEVDE